MNTLSIDLIHLIQQYLDPKSFVNSLRSSKLFNIKDHNSITKNTYLSIKYNYMEKKYKNESIDGLAKYGDLEGIKWLHENGEECTQDAMNWAAIRGHLEVVKFLHFNRKEGCSRDAMDKAAGNGHLDVVKFLHINRREGCSTDAMDNAAWMGHLDIVIWLHENRIEGCSAWAVRLATEMGQLDIVKWLHDNKLSMERGEKRYFVL